MSAGRDASFLLLLKGAAALRLHRETEEAAALWIQRLVAVTAAQRIRTASGPLKKLQTSNKQSIRLTLFSAYKASISQTNAPQLQRNNKAPRRRGFC